MRKIGRLILHHTASDSGTVASIDKEHKEKGWIGIGYHTLILNAHPGPDGHISQGRPDSQVGAAVKNRNAGNLYCCLVGKLHEHSATRKQLHALGHWLLKRGVQYNIKSQDILGHREWALPSNPTQCPGLLPLDKIRKWYHDQIGPARRGEIVQSLAEYLLGPEENK